MPVNTCRFRLCMPAIAIGPLHVHNRQLERPCKLTHFRNRRSSETRCVNGGGVGAFLINFAGLRQLEANFSTTGAVDSQLVV
jgi:hypothetical protein